MSDILVEPSTTVIPYTKVKKHRWKVSEPTHPFTFYIKDARKIIIQNNTDSDVLLKDSGDINFIRAGEYMVPIYLYSLSPLINGTYKFQFLSIPTKGELRYTVFKDKE